MNLSDWETKFESKISEVASSDDPAHDLLHFKRVVGLAKYLCDQEGGNREVVVPAAWLHDLVIVPKDSPLRNQASRLSAEKAAPLIPDYFFSAIIKVLRKGRHLDLILLQRRALFLTLAFLLQ